jgi:hypothetical protein
MRNLFGWDLPPGVSQRMIDEQCEGGPCECCGHPPEDCICPECDFCESVGDPKCYLGSKFGGGHDLVYSKTQKVGQTKLKIAKLEEEIIGHRQYLEWLEGGGEEPDFGG